MIQAYNFLASWQLFPEKCDYENDIVPKSGNYKIESVKEGHALSISMNWVSVENDAFYSQYEIIPNNQVQSLIAQNIADSASAIINTASTLTIHFYKQDKIILTVLHEILPNGYLKLTQTVINEKGQSFINKDVYHKQLSVLPYASSVGSVAIRPTKEGVIKHKALAAMEEQTNMHLNQIKEQIELLAKQAQEIRKRKELSLMIYDARLSFKPQIGHTYHLYEKLNGSHILSFSCATRMGRQWTV